MKDYEKPAKVPFEVMPNKRTPKPKASKTLREIAIQVFVPVCAFSVAIAVVHFFRGR